MVKAPSDARCPPPTPSTVAQPLMQGKRTTFATCPSAGSKGTAQGAGRAAKARIAPEMTL